MAERLTKTAPSPGRSRDAIAGLLRGQIIEGTLQPGEILNLEHIMETLGVGRTPLREALIQLEHEGLIEFEPKRWTRVTPLSLPELESFYPVWIEFQVLAVRFAVQRGCPNLATIAAAQTAFVEAIRCAEQSPGRVTQTLVYRADAHFHAEILRGSENKHLALAIAPLSSLAQRYDHCYFGGLPAIGHKSIADHAQILAALERGDGETAAEIMRVNAARTLDLVTGGQLGFANT